MIQTFFRPLRLTPVLFGAALAFVGCSRSEVDLGQVHGAVTMNGEPLANATILFEPVGGGRTAIGMTDDQGAYSLEYSATASGALVGPVKIQISTLNPDDPRNFPETVPARYNAQTELTAEIKKGRQELNFDLQK